MDLSSAAVCFYKSKTPDCLLVRAATHRPGQNWEDVPDHCAVILNDYLYEMVSRGFHARPATPDDYLWSREIALPDLGSALAEAFYAREVPYDWLAIGEAGLAHILPDKMLPEIARVVGDAGHVKHICSCFVASVLASGGWSAPAWLSAQFCPLSPNDVLRAIDDPERLSP